jgi:hypothetical protein
MRDAGNGLAARLRRALRRWFSTSPTVLRFPTDSEDLRLVERAAASAAQSDAINAATVKPCHGSTFAIEVVLARGSDISRARSAIVAALPPGMSIMGGPSPLHGAQMGS